MLLIGPKHVGGGGLEGDSIDISMNKDKNSNCSSSVDDDANQYKKVTKKNFTEDELDDMRMYLFKKKVEPTLQPHQEIAYEDIKDNPLKKGYKAVTINPYILMFECCLKNCGDEKYKNYYKMIKNCDKIIKKNLSISYVIKKHFEVLSMKSLLMAKYPFKCHFDSIDVNNADTNQSIMDECEHEYQELVVRDKKVEELDIKNALSQINEIVEETKNQLQNKENKVNKISMGNNDNKESNENIECKENFETDSKLVIDENNHRNTNNYNTNNLDKLVITRIQSAVIPDINLLSENLNPSDRNKILKIKYLNDDSDSEENNSNRSNKTNKKNEMKEILKLNK